jgi:serine/threonine protein kinase
MSPPRPRSPDLPTLAHAAIRPGTVLRETYEVLRLVGAGGMGEVYEVRHRRLAGRYAAKFLVAAIAAEPEVLARFRREAEITSGLRHPNIVQVVDFDQTPDGVPYLVMEYLAGSPLDVRVPPGARLPISQAVWLVNQVASALAAAHCHDIVHRDLKPQNIFLVKIVGQHKEMVKVLDFGISKVRSSSLDLTRTSSVLGTPRYMAPEQTGAPADVDARADQFSLAAITYELLTGAPAFPGETLAEILHAVLHTEPAPLAARGIEVPPSFEQVLRTGLAKQPEARFADILDFSRALEAEARIDEGDSFAHSESSSIGRGPPGRLPERASGTATLFYGGEAVRAPVPAPRSPPSRSSERPLQVRALEPSDPAASFAVDDLDEIPRAPTSRRKVVIAAVALVALLGLLRAFRSPGAPVAVVGSMPAAPAPPAAAPAPRQTERTGEQVRIDVVGAPAGVQVSVDGVVEDLPIELVRGETVHVLRFEAPGYEAREWRVNARKNRTLTVHLSRRKGALPTGATPAAWNDPFTEGAYARDHERRPGAPGGKVAPAPDRVGKRSPSSNPF